MEREVTRVSKPIVLHLVNSVSPTSIPFEIAQHIDTTLFEVVVVSYYDTDSTLEGSLRSSRLKLVGIGAKRKSDMGGCLRLYRAMARVAPDVLHTHHNLSGSLGRLFAKRLGVPVVIDTEHSSQSRNHRYTYGAEWVNRWALRWADAIVCNSRATQKALLGKVRGQKQRGKVLVIYNGVDIHKVDTKREEDLPADLLWLDGVLENNFTICNVAGLRRVKDQRTLILAMKILRDESQGGVLIFVGEGKLKKRLSLEVAQLGLEKNVVFTGMIQREDVYKILQRCNVFVMSSLWEGFCVAVAEAMAARVPVIVTKVGGLPELVGNAGVCVPSSDPNAIAKAIMTLMHNSDKARELGEVGRRRVEESFSLNKTVEEYERLYVDLLEEKGYEVKGISRGCF